jgi:capsular polysaccharide biosynthesis protein
MDNNIVFRARNHMIKKLLTAVILTVVFTGVAIAIGNDEYENSTRPMIQLIKDDQVIESRQMNEQEYLAYREVHKIEQQMDELEAPLEALEHHLEANAESLELAVETQVKNGFYNGNVNIDFDHATVGHDISQTLNKMKPELKKINEMAKEIEHAAQQLEDVFYQQYDKRDFDSIRILDGEDRISFHFNAVHQ